MIPEAKRLNALPGQNFFPDIVTLNSFRQSVLKSVEFNVQFCIITIEIQDVCANRVLSAEFETGKTAST